MKYIKCPHCNDTWEAPQEHEYLRYLCKYNIDNSRSKLGFMLGYTKCLKCGKEYIPVSNFVSMFDFVHEALKGCGGY